MAGRITVPEYVAARAKAVQAYSDGVAESVLATADKTATDNASSQYFIGLGLVWTNAPDSIRKSAERMRNDIEFDFEAAKDGAERETMALWELRTKKFEAGEGPKPALTKREAQKNSTKGVRARRVVLEDTVECIKFDNSLARSAYLDASMPKGDKRRITWTQLTHILATARATRAGESRMKVTVGTAKDGRRRLLGPDYHTSHVVMTREAADGSTEEFTTTSFGSKGNEEDVEVVISLVPSGELFTELQANVAERKKIQASDNSILGKLLEEARLPEFMIREARPRSSDR
jgi:hypothetical protein